MEQLINSHVFLRYQTCQRTVLMSVPICALHCHPPWVGHAGVGLDTMTRINDGTQAALRDLDGSKKHEMEARVLLNQTLEKMDKLEADLHAERVKYVKENESLKADLSKTETWLGV